VFLEVRSEIFLRVQIHFV